MKILIIIVLIVITYSCDRPTTYNTMFQNKDNGENCLTNDNFNIVKRYLLKNGAQVKLYMAGIITDTTTSSIQLLFEDKTIALTDPPNYNRIIIIDRNDKGKIPVYFVSNKKNPCELSAYYSVIDTDENIKTRKDDWCKIVTKMQNDKNNLLSLIDQKKALEIAQKDALTAYRDLSIYTIKIELKDKKWHVDYNLSNPNMAGGGPHYIISGKTGEIISKKYEQ
jgi:hypothetical protein